MPYIQLGIFLNDRLGITSVRIDHNDTGLNDDSNLIETVALTLLKSLSLNKESVQVQDLLNELGIERSKR
jgi:hypothetical protein